MPKRTSDCKLRQVLESFKPRLNYRQLDTAALDISRQLAASNLLAGDKDYSDWASISKDPHVVVNYVKTYITMLVSKLSGAPFRPENDDLAALAIKGGLDAMFTETYESCLNDGYSYLGVGFQDSIPVVKTIDARYIMHNGEDPTLKDATDVVVFEVVPKDPDTPEMDPTLISFSFLSAYCMYDKRTERVKVSHYHKAKDTGYVLDFYDKDPNRPESIPLPNLDRIPVVRFVCDRVELADKRYHYRGIYYTAGSVLKALLVTGTKIQVRNATETDANFITRAEGIANHKEAWVGESTLPVDGISQNGQEIPPVVPITHDNAFLINSFNLWKSVIADMFGPVVSSGSEAVTREEVIARNEVKDAISNIYLTRLSLSIKEVYRVVQMYNGGGVAPVPVFGGYIDNVKRKKEKEELAGIYTLAKECGLNTQGLVKQMLKASDLPKEVKDEIDLSFQQDPYRSPLVLQLEGKITQLSQTIQQQNTQIALLRLQATQRLERQKEFINSTERTKRLEIAQKQMEAEGKQTQEALMAILNDCLAKSDYDGALRILQQIQQENAPLIADESINAAANMFDEANDRSVQSALEETTQQIPQPQVPVQQSPQPFTQAVPRQQDVKQMTNTTAPAPAPRPAVTTFNDA